MPSLIKNKFEQFTNRQIDSIPQFAQNAITTGQQVVEQNIMPKKNEYSKNDIKRREDFAQNIIESKSGQKIHKFDQHVLPNVREYAKGVYQNTDKLFDQNSQFGEKVIQNNKNDILTKHSQNNAIFKSINQMDPNNNLLDYNNKAIDYFSTNIDRFSKGPENELQDKHRVVLNQFIDLSQLQNSQSIDNFLQQQKQQQILPKSINKDNIRLIDNTQQLRQSLSSASQAKTIILSNNLITEPQNVANNKSKMFYKTLKKNFLSKILLARIFTIL